MPEQPLELSDDDILHDEDEFGANHNHEVISPKPLSPLKVMREHRDRMPDWLNREGDDLQLTPDLVKQALSGRVAYYPGSGTDGQLIEVFGWSHSAHCFIYADYQIYPKYPQGYDRIYIQTLASEKAQELGLLNLDAQQQLRELLTAEEGETFARMNLDAHYQKEGQRPYWAEWSILERKSPKAPGPERLALLYVRAEAILVYASLWFRRNAPFAVLLQDHGYGDNWTRFGDRNSPLYRVARQSGHLPEWLLVAEETTPWPDYQQSSGCAPRAGMHGNLRALYKRLEGQCVRP